MRVTILSFFTMLCFAYTTQAQIVNSFPIFEDFDAQTTCGTGCGTACVLSGSWQNITTDDIDWTVDNNGTVSSTTGPSADHTTGAGNFVYVEASSPCFGGSVAIMESPGLDLNGLSNFFLEFWYHMYGQSMGDMFVEVSNDGQATWTQVDSLNDDNDVWQFRSIDLSAYAGDTIYIRFRGITGTNYWSDMALDDIFLGSYFNNDAGVVEILNPVNPITAGSNQIDVAIQNFGLSNLTSTTIEWSVDGMMQTPFNWTGNVARDSVDSTSIGNYNFGNGLFELKAWTSMPNMVADSANSNDTMMVTLCTPLRGSFTVGAAGDFATLEEFASTISSCGIDSHTVVTILPGNYNGRIVLDHVPGTSPSATLTIDGGDTSLVTITNATLSNIHLFGTDYTKIQNMTLVNTATLDAWGIHLQDSAMHDTIANVRIMMDENSTAGDIVGILASASETSASTSGTNAYYTTIRDCHITGAYYGIRLQGNVSPYNDGNVITNCLIDQPYQYGIYAYYQNDFTVTWNEVTNIRSTTGDGFYLLDLLDFDVSYNKAVNVPDYGLYIADGNFDFTPVGRGKVINNYISSLTDYGMYLDDVELTDVFHNTFYSVGGTGARTNDIIDVDIRNNIFISETGLCFDASDFITSTANNVLDYNLYWTPAGNANFADDGTGSYADLAAWQTAEPTLNVNSIETNPVFVNAPTDLTPLSPLVNDLADNTVGVMMDINMVARPLGVNPDMGAVEFEPVADDAAILSLTAPAQFACGDSNMVVEVVVQSIGNQTITNLPITINVAGATPSTLNFTYTGPLNFNETDTVVVGTINTYAGGSVTLDGFIALAGDANNANDTLDPVTFDIIPFEPVAFDSTDCGDMVTLSAQTGLPVSYEWYDAPTGGNMVGSGSTFTVPSVAAQSTYYVQYGSVNGSLTTTFAGGNGCAGNMFDVTTASSANITAFDLNIGTTTAETVEVYYISNSSYIGNETNATPWTLEGTYNVTGAGAGNATNIVLGSGIPVVAGQTTAIYVVLSTGNDIDYTNGLNTYTDGVMTVNTGIGTCGVFPASFTDERSFNGTIYYGGPACSTIRTAATASSLPAPAVDLGADTTICLFDGYVLDAGAGGTNYIWSTADSVQTIAVDFTGDYSVTVTGSNGCETADTVSILANPLPFVNLGGDQTICSNDSATLDAGPLQSAYNWSTGDTTQTIVTNMAGNYSVTITDNNGCNNNDTVEVFVNTLPAIALGNDTTYCTNGTVILDAGAGYADYNWSNGETTQMITVAASGGFGVMVTDTNGCMNNDSINLSIFPAAPAINLGMDTTYCTSDTIVLDAGTGFASYNWSTGESSQTVEINNNSGTFTVTATDANGCESSDNITLNFQICAAVVDVNAGNLNIELFPNPNRGEFNLLLEFPATQEVSAELFSLDGKLVYRELFTQQSNQLNTQIQVSELPAGTYLLKVQVGNEMQTRKVVIVK